MEHFANNAVSNLAATITSAATTLTVISAASFPTPGNYRILIDSELMEVTAASGNTLTVVRGAEGTTAASHSSGASVINVVTSQSLNAIVTIQSAGTEISSRRVLNFVSGATVADNSGSSRCDITVSGGGGGSTVGYGAGSSKPSPGTAGNMYIPNNGAIVSVDTGSAWVGFNPFGLVFTIPPVMSAWTQIQSSLFTGADIPGGGISMLVPVTTGVSLVGLQKAPASPTSYTVIACFSILGMAVNNPGLGIMISDGTKFVVYGPVVASGDDMVLNVGQFNSLTSFSANAFSESGPVGILPNIWLKLVQDGTHRTFYMSNNGITWVQIYQEATANFLTETTVGFGGDAIAGGTVGYQEVDATLLSWSGA